MSTETVTSDTVTTDSALSVSNLWKIFGKGADKIIGTPDAELSRAELKAKTDCVVGVRDVSFEVAPGEIYVLMGLSGSGKSTLIRLINRLVEPSSGSINIDGMDIAKLPAARTGEMAAQAGGHGVPVLCLDAAPERARQRRLRPRNGGSTGRPRAMQVRSSARSACRPMQRRVSRRSCPAACSSGSGWPARWRSIRPSC